MKKQGMYLPEFEHDACGAGFICSLEGKKSNDIIHKALEILEKLEHRGAVSADGKTGDGAGILIDIPSMMAGIYNLIGVLAHHGRLMKTRKNKL